MSGSNSIKCSGVPPHQSLSAWRLCRITQCWVVEKHRQVDGLLSTKLSCPRDVGLRQASAWLYFLTTKPSYPLQTNFASPRAPPGTCLIVWMKDTVVEHLLPATALQATECEGNGVASVGPGPHQSKSHVPSRLDHQMKPVWQALTQHIKVDLLINSAKLSFLLPFSSVTSKTLGGVISTWSNPDCSSPTQIARTEFVP